MTRAPIMRVADHLHWGQGDQRAAEAQHSGEYQQRYEVQADALFVRCRSAPSRCETRPRAGTIARLVTKNRKMRFAESLPDKGSALHAECTGVDTGADAGGFQANEV